MSRYIDEKDVYKLVEPNGVARVHCAQIDELPRADVFEVRHRKWIKKTTYQMGYNCSECNKLETYRSPFCRSCGAKMNLKRRPEDEGFVG